MSSYLLQKADRHAQKQKGRLRQLADANAPGFLNVIRDIGKQSQVPCALYGDCQGTLVLGTYTRFAARLNFTSPRYVAAQLPGVLVVYELDFIDAEGTDLALGYIPRTTPFPGARFSETSRRVSCSSSTCFSSQRLLVPLQLNLLD